MLSFLVRSSTPLIGHLSRILPNYAGALAYHLFCTPRFSSHRASNHEELVARARDHLEKAQAEVVPTSVGRVQTYVFETGSEVQRGSVLLVHGWTSEASFMIAFAEYFRRRGLRVIMLDFPAHGQSDGVSTTLIDCARAVRDVAMTYAPIDFALAHSIGGLATLLISTERPPIPDRHPFKALALISLPNEFAKVTKAFSARLGLTDLAKENFEQRLEEIAERKLNEFTGSTLLAETKIPALLVHANNDDVISHEDAIAIANENEQATLEIFADLGHRQILYASQVMRATMKYFDAAL